MDATAAAAAAAAAAEADAEARLRIGEAKNEAEEKYIALSESSSSVAVSGRYKNKLRLISVVTSGVPKTIDTRKTDLNEKIENFDFCYKSNVAVASCQLDLAANKAFYYEISLEENKTKIERNCPANSL